MGSNVALGFWEIFSAFFIFATIALLPGIILNKSIEKISQLRGIFFVSVASGLAAFLVIFSLLARLIPSYEISLAITIALLFSFRYLVERKMVPASEVSQAKPWLNFISIAFFLLLFFGMLFLRSRFSATYFDPQRSGAEKLFNLQFIQSFLFSNSYPPEAIWLSGSETNYYILPRAVAGLASRFSLTLFGHSESLGLLFHISDVFFVVLGVTTLGTLLSTILRSRPWQGNAVAKPESTIDLSQFQSQSQSQSQTLHTLGLVLSLFPLLGIPFRSLQQAFTGKVDLWSQSRIVENTINEFPFWNFLWADNHSHSTAIFMQITLWFWIFLLLQKTLEPRFRTFCVVLFGAFASSALLMSHSGSVFIDVVLGLAFFVAVSSWLVKEAQWEIAKNMLQRFFALALFSFLLALPDLVTRGQPSVEWYLVPPRLSTSLLDFFNIYFSHSLFLIALFLLIFSQQIGGDFKIALSHFLQKNTLIQIALVLVSVCALFALGRASWAIPLLLVACLHPISSKGPISTGSLFGIFGLFVMPEFLVSNWNMGVEYMRYNTLFRFLFEFYYFLPLLAVLAFQAEIVELLNKKVSVYLGAACICIFSITSVFSLNALFAARAHAPSQKTSSLDGLNWMRTEHPIDWKIAQFLMKLPEKNIRILEECAAQPQPGAYTYTGRISALSGRATLCGWSHHMFLFQKKFVDKELNKRSVWENILDRSKLVNSIYNGENGIDQHISSLKSLKITHIVLGEVEKTNHHNVTLGNLQSYGKVIFQTQDFGVIEIAK